jgi:hypothetical protein
MNQASGVIQVSKAAGTTVRQAWMFAAGMPGYTPVDGDVTLDGQPVTWDPLHTIVSGIQSGNVAADVTSLVKPRIDVAPAGRVDITLMEANTIRIDGEILAVIFDDPTMSTNNSIALLYGAQQPLGDSFTANFADPIDTSDPSMRVQLGLGISFGFQPSGQYSTVDINGTQLTSTAGGQDDCNEPDLATCGDGELLTVGGLDDDPANPPDTTCATADARCDDELYDLLPLLTNGATSVTVNTANPSNDDNLFFASLAISNTTAPPPLHQLSPTLHWGIHTQREKGAIRTFLAPMMHGPTSTHHARTGATGRTTPMDRDWLQTATSAISPSLRAVALSRTTISRVTLRATTAQTEQPNQRNGQPCPMPQRLSRSPLAVTMSASPMCLRHVSMTSEGYMAGPAVLGFLR